MEWNETQKELMALLAEKKLPVSDIISVMMVLTREEKAREMIVSLSRKEQWTPDEICQRAGEIAFGEKESEST